LTIKVTTNIRLSAKQILKGVMIMTCQDCSLNHPRVSNFLAYPLIALADNERQADVDISHTLSYTENCAKAIFQGFERFVQDRRTISAVIDGKSYLVLDLKNYTALQIMSESYRLNGMVIQSMKKLKTSVPG
jgi:hypothetical protein